MKTDENKHLRELSDDELKNVTGGTLSTADRCFGLTGQELLDCTGNVEGNLQPGYPGGSELKPGILKDRGTQKGPREVIQ